MSARLLCPFRRTSHLITVIPYIFCEKRLQPPSPPRRGMSRRSPEESQAAYASAYFPAEEWKLLQDWQKELYRNVMKEIHQALISLGPLIATAVCSLRAKDQEEGEACPVNHQECEIKQTMSPTQSDVMGGSDVRFKINIEAPWEMNTLQDTDKQQRDDCLSAGFPLHNADTCLRKEEPLSMFIDHLGAEIRKNSTDLTSEYEIVSFHIKDEEETCCAEPRDRRRGKRTRAPSGTESVNRKKKVGDHINCSDVSPACEGISGKINTTGLQISNKESNPRSPMWLECYREFRGEKTTQHEITSDNQGHLNLHLGGSNLGRPDPYNERKSDLRSPQCPEDFQETHQNHSTYICSEDTNNNLSDEFNRHMGIHSRERPYACTECEKSFYHKSHLITHHRIHSGEKPYFCTFCHKRFNRKDYLDEHIRIHTGERPYKCTKCQKSFIRKCHLNDHQRKICINPAKTIM